MLACNQPCYLLKTTNQMHEEGCLAARQHLLELAAWGSMLQEEARHCWQVLCIRRLEAIQHSIHHPGLHPHGQERQKQAHRQLAAGAVLLAQQSLRAGICCCCC